jgi:hypothetical protein
MRKLAATGLALCATLALGAAACSEEQSEAQQASTPGWSAPSDPIAAAERANLPHAEREMLDYHRHAHVDVIIDGKPVVVPANLGIQQEPKLIAPLHTHDTSGIVHIESAVPVTFTLGQLFTLWDKPLSPSQVGPVRVDPGQVLRLFRNGEELSGDPALVELTQHAEIVVWVGPAAENPKVPTKFDFPKGT